MPGGPGVGRGRALLLVVLVGGGALLVGAIASGFEAGDSSEAVAGHIDNFPPGSVTLLRVESGPGSTDLYITRPLGGELLALSRAAFAGGPPGAACATVWRPDEEFEGTSGLFREPCRGARYDIEGRMLSGPAARDIDRYRVEVRSDGIVVVDLVDLRRQDRGGAR